MASSTEAPTVYRPWLRNRTALDFPSDAASLACAWIKTRTSSPTGSVIVKHESVRMSTALRNDKRTA